MKRLGWSIAIVLLLSLLLVDPAGAVSDTVQDVTFHPFTMPGDTGCIQWTDATEGTTYNCDPVDLVFSNLTLSQVESQLVADGWSTEGIGSDQWLHFDTPTLVVKDAQLYLQQDLYDRYHIRLWNVPGHTTVVGAVHHEYGLFSHDIDQSWDDAEAFVAGQFCAASASFTCEQSALLTQQFVMQNHTTSWRGWTNDAYATVIAPVTTPSASLSVGVSTNQPSYQNRDTALISVSVSDTVGGAIGGASVVVTVTGAAGHQSTLSGKTNSNGIASFKFRVNSKRDGTGVYTAVAAVSASGYENASGSTTFTVTR